MRRNAICRASETELLTQGKTYFRGFIDTHVHCGHFAARRLIAEVGRADYFGQPFFELPSPRQGITMRFDPRYIRADQTSRNILKVWTEFTGTEPLRDIC